MYNPFGMNNIRSGLGQQSNQSSYDFKGLESRLGKIETGIAGLTKQFGNFQMPGQQTVEPEYAGNTTPNPLTPQSPTGGIPSIPDPTAAMNPHQQNTPTAPPPGGIQALPEAQNTGFNFDQEGGSLMSQLSSAYGRQTHNEQIGRGPAGFTQGFADFFTGEGYYADPRGTFADAPWSISETPITLGSRMGGTLDPYGNPQGAMQDLQQPGPKANPSMNTQPLQQGAGLAGLASMQKSQGYKV